MSLEINSVIKKAKKFFNSWLHKYRMTANHRKMVNRAKAIPEKALAVEASWDGGSAGWCVRLDVWTQLESQQYREVFLGRIGHELGEGYDYNRALLGLVPPYPESLLAQEIGQELADLLSVPFYFPSPNKPALEEVPHWIDYQAGRVSSIPIYLIDPDEVIDYFKDSTVVIIEAFWIYRWRFIPTLSIHVDYQDKNLPDQPKLLRTGSLNLGEFKTRFVLLRKGSKKEYQIGCLDWDDADRGKIIHGKTIPDTAPVDEMVRIGNIIAAHFGVSFYFPSPEKPTHNLPRWNDIQDKNT